MKKFILFLCAFISFNSFAIDGLGNKSSTNTQAKNLISTNSGINYTVNTSQDSVSVIKEYVNSNGIVFAVTWQGQFAPNFNTILGNYSSYAQKNNSTINLRKYDNTIDNLVISKNVTARLNVGMAYLKDQLPSDFDISTLSQ
jgi:formylmethanofuran dehydrogenase subunit E-like metal-binding protein